MKIKIIIYSFLVLYFSSCSNDKNLIRYVDPFIGSDAHGHVFVGANVPFGGVQVGPANFHKGWDWTSSYDPKEEISKLDIPVLIVQGSNDIQIEIKDAQLLHNAAKKSRIEIIQGMNHVFRQAPENRLLNMQTYGNPELSIDNSLVNLIVDFLDEN